MRKTLIGRSASLVAMAADMRRIKRSPDECVVDNARRHLAERMGKLHGLPQKIGQIMSMSDNELQREAFADLAADAEALPFDQVLPTIEKAWGGDIDTFVSAIDTHARAASLGQVHRATLHDGREVAVKVAYPGIRQAVMNDLKLLGWLSVPVGDLRRGFDLSDYRGEIVRDLTEELDYRSECEHQKQFAKHSAALQAIIVPEPVEHLSSGDVLVSLWEDGDTIEQAASWPASDRGELARRMVADFFSLLFDHGVVHGDPHPGNYRFRLDAVRGPTVVLYDYGSVASISKYDRHVLLRLISDTTAKRGDPMALLVALGFNEALLEPIATKLPALCSVMFEPFGQPAKYDLQAWNRKQRIDDILGDDRWNFRMAGPAKLILLMRAFRGLLFYVERLGEPISWERALLPILSRHRDSIERLSIPSSCRSGCGFEAMAKHMRIELHRDGLKKVSLTLPIVAIEDIDNLMGDDVMARVKERRIDLREIVREARRGGYAPTELFTLDEPDERQLVRVWIE